MTDGDFAYPVRRPVRLSSTGALGVAICRCRVQFHIPVRRRQGRRGPIVLAIHTNSLGTQTMLLNGWVSIM